MRQHVQLKGDTVDEKLAHIENILDSFRGRLGRVVLGIIPPVPIITHCDVPDEGVIAELLIPISGVIDRAYIRIGDYENKSAVISASIVSKDYTYTKEFMCDKQSHAFEVQWDIKAGDLIRVTGWGVVDVHIAFAVQPNMSRAIKERHMIEGFLALIEEGENNGVHQT